MGHEDLLFGLMGSARRLAGEGCVLASPEAGSGQVRRGAIMPPGEFFLGFKAAPVKDLGR